MLVQDPKDLGIYDLESRNAINHLLHTLHVVCVCVCVEEWGYYVSTTQYNTLTIPWTSSSAPPTLSYTFFRW